MRKQKYTNKIHKICSVSFLLGQFHIFFNCLVQIQIHFDVSANTDTVGVIGQLPISRPAKFYLVSNLNWQRLLLLGFPLVDALHGIRPGVPLPLHVLLLLVDLCKLVKHVGECFLLSLLLSLQAVLADGDLVPGGLKGDFSEQF